MTEKEKRGRGLLYDANDPALLRELGRAKELCARYNQLSPLDRAGQQAILGQLLGRAEGPLTILPWFWCDYGYNIEIGGSFFANHNLVILDCAGVTFGDNVFIGPNCGFYTAGHPMDAALRRRGLEYARPIRVGSEVWIGGGVQVMPGASIGSNVVIGGGSVVTGDIPDNSLAAGNPCRVLRPLAPGERPPAEVDSRPPFPYNRGDF